MLGYIKGTIKAKTEKNLIIECNGLGYTVFTTTGFLSQNKTGEPVEMYLHTYVREDVLELYGLPSLEALEFFKRLIGISGVGPKSALGIFEVAKVDDLKRAIAHGDPSLLT